MVPRQHNGTINPVSQSHNDNNSPGNLLLDILKGVQKNEEELLHLIKRNQIDINTFADEPVSGTATVVNPVRLPILITDIIATWTVTTIALTALNQIVLGATGVASENNNPYAVALTISGGTVTAIAINGTVTGLTSGTFYVPAAGTVTVTYSVTPTVFTTANLGADLQPVNGTATLTVGGRTFQLPYQAGYFLLTSLHGLQLDNNSSQANKVVLTVTPAAAVHLEIAGMADYRKVERL
jgi:hypothetical protein